MHRILASLALALTGCSTGTSLNPGSPPTRIIETGTGYDVYVAQDAQAPQHPVPAAPQQAWPALMEVYQELGIPLTTLDQREMLLGNQRYATRRRLAGMPMSSLLNCGSNLSGDIASTYSIQMSVVSKLEPAPGGSSVQTRINATARSTEGASGNPVTCTSTGRLESTIAEKLAKRLGS